MVEFSQKQAHRNSVKLLQTNAGVWSYLCGYRKNLKDFSELAAYQKCKRKYRLWHLLNCKKIKIIL